MELIVVSIGALSKNPLWGEKIPVRTSHATTTLIRTGSANLLIDPSLPPEILEARLFDRSGLKPAEITHVFLSNWRPIHRRGLGLFEKALWWISELEKQTAEEVLENQHRRNSQDPELLRLLKTEELLLRRCVAAPDELMDNIDLFPLPGYTPGQCGLLVSQPTSTVVIAGDAVPTAGHFSAGQVFHECFDLSQAKDSLVEMYEIADQIIPGHDNLFLNPRHAGL